MHVEPSIMPRSWPTPMPGRVRSVGDWSLVDLWYPGETNRAIDLKRRNEELNKRKIELGQMTEEAAAAQETRFNENDPSTWSQELAQEFLEGAGEGLASMPEKFRSAVTTAAGWTLSFVPWWAWGIGVLVAAKYLGVFDNLRGSASGVLARRIRKATR